MKKAKRKNGNRNGERRDKNKIPKTLISTGLALSMFCSSVTPAFAMLNVTKNNTSEQNQDLLRQITELAEDNTKTPEQKLSALLDLGVFGGDETKKALADATREEKERFASILAEIVASDTIHLNGEECSLDTIRQMLADPDVDLSQKVDVDGIEVTMGDLKTMVEIEDQIQAIADSYLFPEDMTEEQKKAYDSILNQLDTDGIELSGANDLLQTLDTGVSDQSGMTQALGASLLSEGEEITYNHDARITIGADVQVQNIAGMAEITFTQPELDYETSFTWRTVDGSAQAGTNYTAASGTVTFAPGETEKKVEVQILRESGSGLWDYNCLWDGNQEFLVVCDNAENILFSNDRSSCTVPVKISHSYDYDAYKTGVNRTSTWAVSYRSFSDFLYESIPDDQNNTGSIYDDGTEVRVLYTCTLTDALAQALYDGRATGMFVDSESVRPGSSQVYAKVMVGDTTALGANAYYSSITPNNIEEFVKGIPGITTIMEKEESAKQDESGNCTYLPEQAPGMIDLTEELREQLASCSAFIYVEHHMQYTGLTEEEYQATERYPLYIDYLQFCDNAKPVLESVEVPAGTYYPGQSVPIIASFSEPVKYDGATLTVNDTEISAADSTSTSDRILFYYQVPMNPAANIQVTGVKGVLDTSDNAMDADTETRVFDEAKLSAVKAYTFQSVSLDKASYSPAGDTAQVEISLDTSISQWLEQEKEDSLPVWVSAGGEKVRATWKRVDGVDDSSKLTASVPLPQNTDAADKSVQIELFLGADAATAATVIGKAAKARIRAAVYPQTITIDQTTYPKENIIYFVSPPQFRFTTDPAFSSIEPAQEAVWSSSAPEVATIDSSGRVTCIAEGKVSFTVTLQGQEGPISATTPEFQVKAGDFPFISISGNIVTSVNTDTTVSWNTNVTYKNKQNGVETTTYTVRLYKGNYVDTEMGNDVNPIETWTVKNENSILIPADLLTEISSGGQPAYTVTVTCEHPDYQDQFLTAKAGIVTRALPVVVRFDRLENYYITDKTNSQTLNLTFQNADLTNGFSYSYTVKKNGVSILTETNSEYKEESLVFSLEIAPVKGRLRDIYIVSAEAYNEGDTPSADSFILYVYRDDMMDIQVDGQKTDSFTLDNNTNPAIAQTTGVDTTSGDLQELRENANLSAVVEIDRGDYEWSNVDDQISWNSSNNSVANLNYQQGGVYSDITQYDYSTFRPSSQFMLVGHSDGTSAITATHAKTGQTTSIDVSVTTLKDKLYVFNLFPRQKTTLTYTNGDGQRRTLTTNDKGEIAVYEESGIASDISLRSGSEDSLYLGTIYRTNLISSENDPSKLELYPVNSFRLRPSAEVDVYILQEDGTPYSGPLSVSGGVYKNGKYCAATEMKNENITIGADGKLHLTLDSTKFWTDSSTEDLNAGDQLEYVFIARTLNDEYYPLFISIDGSVGVEENAVFAANSLLAVKVPDGKKNKPFVAAQTARLPKTGSIWSPVQYYNDVIGISDYANEMEIKTTVLWWGDENDGSASDVYLTDEYNRRLSAQRTSAVTRYPFSDIAVSENIVTMNGESCGLESGEKARLRVNLTGGDGALILSQDTAFSFYNGTGIILPDSDKSLKEQLNAVQPDGYATDTSDSNYQQGGEMAAPGTMELLSNLNVESSFLTMALYPTSDPREWRFLIEVNADFMGEGDKDGKENTVMIDQSVDKVSYLPGPLDLYQMIKGTYKQTVTNDFKEALKTGTGKEAAYGAKLGGFYEGTVTWNSAAQKWEMKTRSGGFTYGLAAGYTWSVNTMVGPIPVTASASIGGGLEMDHKILMTTHGEGMTKEEFQNLLVTMRINAYIKAFVGIGFDITVLAIKFGVFGQVDLDNYNAFLYYKDQDTGKIKDIAGQHTELTGTVGIEFYLKILFFKYRKVLASKDITYGSWNTGKWEEIEEWRKNAKFPSDFGGYNKDTIAAVMALSSLPEFETVAEGMFVEDRDYLQLAERVWGEPSGGVSLFSLDDPNKMANLQSNSYPYANPMVTEDGQLLVFLSDGENADLNRTRVEYSLYDESTGQYKAPQVLDNSEAAQELADSGLQLSGDSEFAVAAWQRQNQRMDLDPGQEANADDLNAMMSATEIFASVWNGNGWATEQLTSNSLPDMAPVAASNGNSAIVVWRRVASSTTANVEKISFDAQDELVYRQYKDGKWEDAQVLYNGTMGAVKGLSAAMDSEGNAVVTYTVDTSSYIGQSETQALSDSSSETGSESFEIAYSLIKADGTAESPVRFTTDSYADENPQVTVVELDGEERFVTAWYSQRPLTESGTGSPGSAEESGAAGSRGSTGNSVAVSSDIQMRLVNADGSLYDNFADSIREIQNSGSVAIGSQFRFSKGADSINDLSLVWVSPAMEYVEESGSTGSYDRDELYAVKFYQSGDNAPVYLSAPLPVVSAEENTKIDHFDTYFAKEGGEEKLKAVLQTTEYDIDNPALQEVIKLDDGGTVTLATPISSMKTATGIFENAVTVSDPIFDYFSVKHDSSLPIQITITNTGKDAITDVEIVMKGNNEETKTSFNDLGLAPNASKTLTVYQPLPPEGTLIENLNYTVTAAFSDGSEVERSGEIPLQIPDVGISSFETTKEENGERIVQLKMYNRSDIELEKLTGYTVKVGFYEDNTCNTPLKGDISVVNADGKETPLTADEDGNKILTIGDSNSDQTLLNLIDNDAFVGNFAYKLPDTGFEDGNIEIYVRAWIVDGDGNEVAEAYQSNNMGSVVFSDPVERNNGNQFLLTSELSEGSDGTHAEVTVKNLALAPTGGNGNLIVSLLDSSGNVLETKQTISDSSIGLIALDKEASRTFSFDFSKQGVAVRCSYVAVSSETTDAALSSLEIDGVPLKFDPQTLEYEVEVENLQTANVRAVASNPKATIELTMEDASGSSGESSSRKDNGILTGSLPMELSDTNGETKTNVIKLTVTPVLTGAPAQTYTIRLNNQTVSSGSVELEAPTWINQGGSQEIYVNLRNFGGTPVSFTTQVDGGTVSGPVKWLGGTEQKTFVEIPDEEGRHTIDVALSDETGFATKASKEIIVDKTPPVMTETDIRFEETDTPLYKDSGVNLLSGVPTENDGITENQLEVYIKATDALSGVDRVTASAGSRTYTAELTDSGEYKLTVTYAFRGPLVITAYDRAGNSTSVMKQVNVDDEMPMGDILTGDAVITQTSATLYGTVTTKDDYLATYGIGIQYRKAADPESEWIDVPMPEGAGKNSFAVTVNDLTPETDYVYRVYVRSIANVLYYGETKSFRTPRAPMTGNLITSFYLEGQTGAATIDDKTCTIAVTVPYRMDLEALSSRLASVVSVAVSENAQYEVKDILVDENKLTAKYVVTAESSAEKTYALTVTRAGQPTIDLTSFEGLEQTSGLKTIQLKGEDLGNADEIVILLFDSLDQEISRAVVTSTVTEYGSSYQATITVPENTDIDRAAVYTFGYMIDGRQTVTDKTITVPRRTSGDCTLLKFDVEGAKQVTVDAAARRITVEMPYGYAGDTVAPKLEISAYAEYKLLDGDGAELNALPVEGIATLAITAEDGVNTASYQISVTRQEKPQVYLMTFDADPRNESSRVAVYVKGVNLDNAEKIEVTATDEKSGLSLTAQASRSDGNTCAAMLDIPEYLGLFEDRTFRLSASVDGVPQEQLDSAQKGLVQPKNDNVIESFTVEGQIGETVIVHGDGAVQGEIRVTVPYDADLSRLNASIVLRDGVTAEPADATDFTAPVTLRLSKANHANRSYTVTVVREGTPVLTGFDFEPFTSSKAGDITVALKGENLDSFRELLLTATDGETTVSAKVESIDGRLQATLSIPENTDPREAAAWTLSLTENGQIVTVPAAQITVQPKLEILEFSIPNQKSCQIDGDKITVKMPSNAALNALTPQIELTPGAFILEPTGGTVDFTEAVTYRIQLGSDIATYTVSISKESSGGGGGGGGNVPETVYTVHFNTQAGSSIESVKVSGGTVARPADPTREGYTFEGWFTDPECTEAYDFSAEVSGNMTLYAKWTEENIDPQPQEWANPFNDVKESDWFYDAVRYASENGLFNGTTQTTFSPETAITRGMLVTVLWRLEQQPAVDYLTTFRDVVAESYYAEAVRWAASEEIVNGYSDRKFAPDRLITREEMAALINRYAQYKGLDSSATGDLSQFTDRRKISDWAEQNLAWAVGEGLINGKGGGVLDPKGDTTRAETAALLQRFLEK